MAKKIIYKPVVYKDNHFYDKGIIIFKNDEIIICSDTYGYSLGYNGIDAILLYQTNLNFKKTSYIYEGDVLRHINGDFVYFRNGMFFYKDKKFSYKEIIDKLISKSFNTFLSAFLEVHDLNHSLFFKNNLHIIPDQYVVDYAKRVYKL